MSPNGVQRRRKKKRRGRREKEEGAQRGEEVPNEVSKKWSEKGLGRFD